MIWWAASLLFVATGAWGAAPDDCAWLTRALRDRFALQGSVTVEDCARIPSSPQEVRIEQVQFDGGAAVRVVARVSGRRVPLRVRAWAESSVWIATRDLAAGTLLRPEDVRSGMALLPLADALAPRPPLEHGWRTRRRIPRGEAVLAQDLRAGNEIASGQVCDVLLQRGAVRIRTRARVRQLLDHGRRVRLERLNGRSRLMAGPGQDVRIVSCEEANG